MTEAITIGTAVALLLLISLLISRLTLTHARGLAAIRTELANARAGEAESRDARRDALREAAKVEAATLLAGLRAHHDQAQSDLRAQVASADIRARAAERAASDMKTGLETATALVRELRAILDTQRGHRGPTSTSTQPDPIADDPDSDARKTIDMPRPRAGFLDDDEPEEELTRVAKRPPGAALTGVSNGFRLAASRAMKPPSIAPPGSATVLPPEPAHVAAGLGPRPISRPIPTPAGASKGREAGLSSKLPTPHPRPVRVATLMGIAVPTARSGSTQSNDDEPRSGPLDDDDAWACVDRLGEPNRPRALPNSAPHDAFVSRAPLGTAATLPSMQAVSAPHDQLGDEPA